MITSSADIWVELIVNPSHPTVSPVIIIFASGSGYTVIVKLVSSKQSCCDVAYSWTRYVVSFNAALLNVYVKFCVESIITPSTYHSKFMEEISSWLYGSDILLKLTTNGPQLSIALGIALANGVGYTVIIFVSIAGQFVFPPTVKINW